MGSPKLPLEIECVIFLDALNTALEDDDANVLHLLFVAKRVFTWLISELMKSVAIRTEGATHKKYPAVISANLLIKYGTYTRNLFLWPRPASHRFQREIGLTETQCLFYCPNVTNLTLWTELDEPLRDHIASLPLTKLSTRIDDLSGTKTTPSLIKCFSKITHLQILSTIEREADFVKIRDFTSLTHLAVSGVGRWEVLPRLFTKFRTLRVVIALQPGSRHGSDPLWLEGFFNPEFEDPRVVKVACKMGEYLEDWLLDIRMDRGMWGIAERAMVERGKMKAARIARIQGILL